jgi:hypothetical protein
VSFHFTLIRTTQHIFVHNALEFLPVRYRYRVLGSDIIGSRPGIKTFQDLVYSLPRDHPVFEQFAWRLGSTNRGEERVSEPLPLLLPFLVLIIESRR